MTPTPSSARENGEQPACSIRQTDEYFGALGLTKREAFAMAAMQGLLANSAVDSDLFITGDDGAEWYAAKCAVRYADALLIALSEPRP